MIRLTDISKSFDGHAALRHVSLHVAPADVTVIIGPSGCGKSTLLRILVGLVQPDAGDAHVLGEDLSEDNAIALRRRIGYVIQTGGLFPHLTGEQNVTLMARHVGWSSDRIRARLDELAELVRLPADRLALYPVELSGGQQQRVGLMRALFLDPEILLMDEPLGALDPMIRAELQDELKRIFADLRKTVVLVTHDLAEAVHLGDTLVLMREGTIVQIGPPDDLVNRPADAFVTAFVRAQRRFDTDRPTS